MSSSWDSDRLFADEETQGGVLLRRADEPGVLLVDYRPHLYFGAVEGGTVHQEVSAAGRRFLRALLGGVSLRRRWRVDPETDLHGCYSPVRVRWRQGEDGGSS